MRGKVARALRTMCKEAGLDVTQGTGKTKYRAVKEVYKSLPKTNPVKNKETAVYTGKNYTVTEEVTTVNCQTGKVTKRKQKVS